MGDLKARFAKAQAQAAAMKQQLRKDGVVSTSGGVATGSGGLPPASPIGAPTPAEVSSPSDPVQQVFDAFANLGDVVSRIQGGAQIQDVSNDLETIGNMLWDAADGAIAMRKSLAFDEFSAHLLARLEKGGIAEVRSILKASFIDSNRSVSIPMVVDPNAVPTPTVDLSNPPKLAADGVTAARVPAPGPTSEAPTPAGVVLPSVSQPNVGTPQGPGPVAKGMADVEADFDNTVWPSNFSAVAKRADASTQNPAGR